MSDEGDDQEAELELYGESYWQSMDNGAGTRDSVMWQDLAFIIHHTFAHTPDGRDVCGEMRHVDAGCGMGFLVGHMRRRGFESYGLDVSDYALDNAPVDVKPHLRKFDLAWVDDSFFGREKFHIVTALETLEHIPQEFADRAIEHIWNLLVPGGFALLNICVKENEDWNRDPTHVNVTERDWWLPVLIDQGFKLDKQRMREIKQFHLFTNYDGTFIVRKP